jgi:hypothetical protein
VGNVFEFRKQVMGITCLEMERARIWVKEGIRFFLILERLFPFFRCLRVLKFFPERELKLSGGSKTHRVSASHPVSFRAPAQFGFPIEFA